MWEGFTDKELFLKFLQENSYSAIAKVNVDIKTRKCHVEFRKFTSAKTKHYLITDIIYSFAARILYLSRDLYQNICELKYGIEDLFCNNSSIMLLNKPIKGKYIEFTSTSNINENVSSINYCGYFMGGIFAFNLPQQTVVGFLALLKYFMTYELLYMKNKEFYETIKVDLLQMSERYIPNIMAARHLSMDLCLFRSSLINEYQERIAK